MKLHKTLFRWQKIIFRIGINEQLPNMYPNVPMIAVCMSICMVVFVTGATPAGSPYAAMLHGQKDKITFKQIETCALPMLLAGWVLYTFIGYNFAKIVFGLF